MDKCHCCCVDGATEPEGEKGVGERGPSDPEVFRLGRGLGPHRISRLFSLHSPPSPGSQQRADRIGQIHQGWKKVRMEMSCMWCGYWGGSSFWDVGFGLPQIPEYGRGRHSLGHLGNLHLAALFDLSSFRGTLRPTADKRVYIYCCGPCDHRTSVRRPSILIKDPVQRQTQVR